MPVFADTSGLYAALHRLDTNHPAAASGWAGLAARRDRLITSNYVLLETIGLLERRVGLLAVERFVQDFSPILEIHWIDETLHNHGLSVLLTARDRDLSPVDCTSFALMRLLGVSTAFAIDEHFVAQGFNCIP